MFKKSSDAVDMHAILALDVKRPHSANRPIGLSRRMRAADYRQFKPGAQ